MMSATITDSGLIQLAFAHRRQSAIARKQVISAAQKELEVHLEIYQALRQQYALLMQANQAVPQQLAEERAGLRAEAGSGPAAHQD